MTTHSEETPQYSTVHRLATIDAATGEPRLSADLYKLLVESVVDYAIFMLDANGVVASWNNGARRIKGYEASEIIGRHFSTFYPPDAIARNWPATELERATADGRFEDEGWRVRKDGTRFWANVVITALKRPDGGLLGFAKVTRDLTEHKRVQALELEAHRMNEFIAMLAHELRNPLAPIRNAVGILNHATTNPATVSWASDVIGRQTNQLTRLVDDLLDISRITRGKIKLANERVEVAEVSRRAIETVRPLIESRRQVMVETFAPGLEMNGDAARMTQVIANLLHNASKFTPAGGRIEIETTRANGYARVVVRDNGIGLSDDFKGRVFDAFSQGDRGLDRTDGGLGLGLTIAKQLIELQGGVIRADSRGPGLGAEFTIDVPVAAPEQASIDTGTAPPSQGRSLAILVVDDNVDSAASMKMLLDLEGHRAELAHDGLAALDVADAFRPDVVLLDIGLPKLSGYDVAMRLRANPQHASIVLVAITGYGHEEDRKRSKAAGFDAHFAKPVDFAQLSKLLADVGGTRDRTAR